VLAVKGIEIEQDTSLYLVIVLFSGIGNKCKSTSGAAAGLLLTWNRHVWLGAEEVDLQLHRTRVQIFEPICIKDTPNKVTGPAFRTRAGCRQREAHSLSPFWQLLCNRRSSIVFGARSAQ
jgi:hypothetical protein